MISFRRLYHVSSAMYNNKKMGIKLNKMINPKSKRRFFPAHLDLESMPSIKSLAKTECEPGKRAMRRTAMLNKMFMKHITDLMSTGTVAMDIVGRGIEISKVKITPDLQSVNVFWVCKGNLTDVETEAALNKIAGPLRHELSTLRIIGEIPYIYFVKDRHEAKLVDLDRRLAIADYGEDYTPTDMGHLLKSEFTLNTKLSPEMQAKIKRLEEEDPPTEDPIPEMTNNVFGLDHDKIMSRLLAARKKTKDAWNRLDDAAPVISYRVDDEKQGGLEVSDQRKELADFLLKRRILQNQIYKELRASADDWQLDHQDQDEHEEYIFIDDYDDEVDHDDDYLYDDFRIKDKDNYQS